MAEALGFACRVGLGGGSAEGIVLLWPGAGLRRSREMVFSSDGVEMAQEWQHLVGNIWDPLWMGYGVVTPVSVLQESLLHSSNSQCF